MRYEIASQSVLDLYKRVSIVKVLVTGGTGFLGSHLVDHFFSSGHQVVCLVRKTSDITRLRQKKVPIIYGDLTDKTTLRELRTAEVDVVTHLAGILGQWSLTEETYRKINVEGTKNIMDIFLPSMITRLSTVFSCKSPVNTFLTNIVSFPFKFSGSINSFHHLILFLNIQL